MFFLYQPFKLKKTPIPTTSITHNTKITQRLGGISKRIESINPKHEATIPTSQPKQTCIFNEDTNKIILKIGKTKNEKTKSNPTNFTDEVTTRPKTL